MSEGDAEAGGGAFGGDEPDAGEDASGDDGEAEPGAEGEAAPEAFAAEGDPGAEDDAPAGLARVLPFGLGNSRALIPIALTAVVAVIALILLIAVFAGA